MKRLRDIHKNKHRKYSRRRVLGILGTAGVSGVTASTITSEDIQAAASDEIPVALDLQGESKWYVPIDWYETLLEVRETYEQIKYDITSQKAVIGININPGELGGENPHLVIDVNEDDNDGRNPAEDTSIDNSDVEIKIRERSKPERTETTTSDDVETDGIIDTDPCGTTTTPGDIPGGLEVVFDGARGTLTSRVMNGSDEGWLTNSHVASYSTEDCGSDLIGAEAEHGGTTIGEIVEVDHDRDFVVIEPTTWRDPEPEVIVPSNHSTNFEITGTMSPDGFDTFSASGWDVTKVGTTSCETTGEVHERGRSVTVKANDNCRSWGDTYSDQCSWGSATNDIRPGDSGSLTFGENPDGSGHLGMCINIAVTGLNRVHGTPGWIIEDISGYEWG